jgi:hypothetical protein
MKKNIFISFSGGRTSAFLAYWLKYNSKDNLKFVFANTGKELPETLDFVNECDVRWDLNINWVEYDPQEEYGKKNWFKIVNYKNASRNGEPFERFIKKENIPNAAYPNCSGRLKSLPMHNFIKHHIGWKDYYTAIGIRYDEKNRINWEAAKKNKWIYPLATDYPIGKQFIREWWDKQDFDLGLMDYQGNCDFCWKKSDRKLITMIRDGFDISWWVRQEIKYGNGEYTFFRNNKSATDLIELSEDKLIKSVKDEHEINKKQCSLFSSLDIEGKCFCNFD